MPPLPPTPMNFYDRAQIASSVYNSVTAHTDDQATTAALAHLMGTILHGRIGTVKDEVLAQVLESEFNPDHGIWRFVEQRS